MQNKIVVICVSILFIATAIPAVTSLNDRIITPKVSCRSTQRGSLDNWIEMQKLLASDGEANDEFGLSVSISGDTALIGAFKDSDNGQYSGSAYVFIRTSNIEYITTSISTLYLIYCPLTCVYWFNSRE